MNAQVCPNCTYPLLCSIHKGKPYGYCLYCHQEVTCPVDTEITDASQIKLALQKSYHWLNSLIQTSLEGIWVLNRAGETVFVNQRMIDFLGYSLEEMRGKPAWDFVEPGERSQFIHYTTALQEISKLSRNAKAIDSEINNHFPSQQEINKHYEVKLQHSDGSLIWVNISGYGMYDTVTKLHQNVVTKPSQANIFQQQNEPKNDEYGDYLGTLYMVTDISQQQAALQARKLAEEQLQELKDTLQTVIQSSPLAIIALDGQGKVRLWNQSAEKMFGWKEQEVLGNFLPQPSDQPNGQPQLVPDQISQLIGASEETSFTDLETRYYRQDGSVVDISLSTAPLHDSQGRVVGNMGVAADITLIKQMQESLLQQAQRERVITAIAQRIRQSLNFSEILETTVLEVQKLLRADRVLIVRFLHPDQGNADQGNVVAQALANDTVPSMRGFMISIPLLNMANHLDRYYQGEALAINDVDQTELAENSRQLLDFFQIKSLLVVPILQKQPENFSETHQIEPPPTIPLSSNFNSLWGLLMVHQCQELRHWDSSEINLLKQLATQVSIALWQGRLYQQAQLQAVREKTLNRLTRAIRRTLDLKTIFSTAVWEFGNQYRSQRVEIWQYFTHQKVWRNVSEYRGDLDTPIGLGTEISDQDNSVSSKLKQLEIVKNRTLAHALNQDNIVCHETCLLVPLHFNNQVWGAFAVVMDSYVYDWQDEEIEFMVQIADQLAIAIQQSELYLQLQDANKKLQQLADTDGLTQVANRRYFDEILTQEWQRLARDQQPLSLLLTDIDWFKSYNDHYGHQAGDDCLQQVAQAINQAINRPADLLARYGGEEFVIVLPNTDTQGAVKVAEKIRQVIAKLAILHPDSTVSPYVTVSVGVASMIPTNEIPPNMLISQADQALYLAKYQGRDRFLVYDKSTLIANQKYTLKKKTSN